LGAVGPGKIALPLLFDMSRLLSRFSHPTPDGIDRVEHAYARYVLSQALAGNGAVLSTPFGKRLYGADYAEELLRLITSHWQEDGAIDDGAVFSIVKRQIIDGGVSKSHGAAVATARALRVNPRRPVARIASFSREVGLSAGRPAERAAAAGAIYLHSSQHELNQPRRFRWLHARPDIRSVFFIHDILPIQYPEYFKPGEAALLTRKLELVMRLATMVVVSTHVVREALVRHFSHHGRPDLAVVAIPLAVQPIFQVPAEQDMELAAAPYFVMCGTLEPRKNHLMLLNIWRKMAREGRTNPPKLVLVGTRGWENENILDMIERSPGIEKHVLEISGLPTRTLRRLLANARGLLMPSFDEGFGLPIIEALATGTPVVASDIPVFREIGGTEALYRGPLDGPGWTEAVRLLQEQGVTEPRVGLRVHTWDDHFSVLQGHLDGLNR
jgi:glycosyltransferase involved in cell wall biosynthesis